MIYDLIQSWVLIKKIGVFKQTVVRVYYVLKVVLHKNVNNDIFQPFYHAKVMPFLKLLQI